jgi:hypothetical protein
MQQMPMGGMSGAMWMYMAIGVVLIVLIVVAIVRFTKK